MMTRQLPALVALCATLALPTSVSAQRVVHDPTHYAQTVITYRQIVEQYRLLLEQARRLPVDLAARYRVPTLPWPSHVATATIFAQPLLDALNRGDASGARYAETVAPLDPLEAVLATIPAALQARVGMGYATIELADQVARTAVHQAGALRTQGENVTRTIRSMEDDAVSTDSRFHTQAALLNKINTASVLGVRIAEQTSQSVLHVVEQLLVANKRQRDAEAKLMNAQIHQWQYGQGYGDGLVRETARALDTWRQP